jgi:hypothetical protein
MTILPWCQAFSIIRFWAIAILGATRTGLKVLIFRCFIHEKCLKAKLLLLVSSDKWVKMKNAIAQKAFRGDRKSDQILLCHQHIRTWYELSFF